MDEVVAAAEAAAAASDWWSLAYGLLLGAGGAVFAALLWLRVWRWFFALMGLRA